MTERVSDARLRVLEEMGATDGDPEIMPSQEEVYQMVAELLDQRTAGQVRPGSEYHEDMGPVLWLEFAEYGYPNVHAGTPTDSDWPFADYSIVVFTALPHYDAVKAADDREGAILAALAKGEWP